MPEKLPLNAFTKGKNSISLHHISVSVRAVLIVVPTENFLKTNWFSLPIFQLIIGIQN